MFIWILSISRIHFEKMLHIFINILYIDIYSNGIKISIFNEKNNFKIDARILQYLFIKLRSMNFVCTICPPESTWLNLISNWLKTISKSWEGECDRLFFFFVFLSLFNTTLLFFATISFLISIALQVIQLLFLSNYI